MGLTGSLVAAAGLAVLELDTSHAGLFLLSRPLVLGPVLGAVFGQLTFGSAVGALFELLSFSEIPIGGHLPLNAAVATGSTLLMALNPSPVPLELAFPAGMALGWGHRGVEGVLRWRRGLLGGRAEGMLKQGKEPGLGWAVSLEIGKGFLLNLEFFGGAVLVSPLLVLGWLLMPESLKEGFKLGLALSPGLAFGVLIHYLGARFQWGGIRQRSGYPLPFEGKPERGDIKATHLSPGSHGGSRRQMSPGMRIKLFFRLLLLQACWSFERMQGLGFAYALEPWLESCYSDPADLRAALARHQEFFNTHPYMAPMVLGMVCALEEDTAARPKVDRAGCFARMTILKKSAANSLAGIGDSLFWGSLRPFCVALALAVGFLSLRFVGEKAFLAMSLAYLVAYNAPAVVLRWRGLQWGYSWKEQLAAGLQGFPWQNWIRGLRLVGFVLAVAAFFLILGLPGITPWSGLAWIASVGISIGAMLLLPKATPYRLFLGTYLLGVVAAAGGLTLGSKALFLMWGGLVRP
jgi:mannose/fructose/N-acetylgalactosamine-specific phosphotransferase system component IID/mannose/fructose/N-acetylgalactosamine-specific phosphotransferase system component IIC